MRGSKIEYEYTPDGPTEVPAEADGGAAGQDVEAFEALMSLCMRG